MRTPSTVVALLTVIALGACSSSDTANTVTPDARLTAQMKALLLTDTLPGYVLQSNADKALGTQDASQATSADPSKTFTQLGQSSFEGGFERVFKLDTSYITILVFDYQVSEDAAAMVQFQVGELRASGGNVVVPDPLLPNAYAYDLEGTTRSGALQVYCGGEWFTLDRFAFNVDYCSTDQGTSSNLARLEARNQYQKAGLALGLVSPPPTPSPYLIEPAPPNS